HNRKCSRREERASRPACLETKLHHASDRALMTDTLSATDQPAALAGLRVLDLSGPMGNYCGKLFGDLGADVILVEPPQGTALRRLLNDRGAGSRTVGSRPARGCLNAGVRGAGTGKRRAVL